MDANEIITSITERVKDAANVRVVFGEPVETTSGVTIIPVASVKVAGGGGGGTGRGRRRESEETAATGNEGGMGLGLKVMATPLGYIEVKDGTARFVHIADMTKIAVGGMLLTGLLLLAATRCMRFKAWKQRQKMGWRHAQGGH
jgi:uncharacterized spore protein YtfJ